MPPEIVIPIAISVASMGASYALQQFTQKSLKPGDRDFEVNRVDSKAHLPVVYGKAKLGIHRNYTNTDPDDDTICWFVGSVCHGEIQGFRKIWFDGGLAIDFRDDPAGIVQGKYKNYVDVWTRNGSDNETVYQELQDAVGSGVWTNQHLGRGVASICLKLKGNINLFPNSVPNITCLVEGKKIWDLRADLLVEDCEDVWNESTGTGVTVSTFVTDDGTNANRFTLVGVAANTMLATEVISKDLSSYNALTFKIRVNTELVDYINPDDLRLIISSVANCATATRTLKLPVIFPNKWQRCIINYDTEVISDLTSIISIGLKQIVSNGNLTIDIDKIRATRYGFSDTVSNRQLLSACDGGWASNNCTVSTVAEVPSELASYSTHSTRLTGAAGTNIPIDAILGYTNFASARNLSTYDYVIFWLRADVSLENGDLKFVFASTTNCTTIADEIKIPKLEIDNAPGSSDWMKVKLKLKDPTLLTSIWSVGIKQVVPIGAISVIDPDVTDDTDPTKFETTTVTPSGFKIDIDTIHVADEILIGENSALCELDYLLNPVYGAGIDSTEKDSTTFIREANFDDELVSGVTVNPPSAPEAKLLDKTGNLSIGKYKYKIAWLYSDGTTSSAGANSKGITTKNNKRQTKLINIPMDKSPECVGANIYRTQANVPEYYYFCDTITFDEDKYFDNIADKPATDNTVRFLNTAITAPTTGRNTEQQARFTCNGIVDTSNEIKVNIEELLTSNRGNIFYEGGIYCLHTRKQTLPETFELTEDNIINDGSWKWTLPGVSDTCNILKASYINRQKSYETDYVVWPQITQENVYLKNDNEFENMKEVDLFYTYNKFTARQIAMVLRRESRSKIKVTLKATEEALKLRVGNVVPVTHSTPAWTQKSFWVDSIAIAMDATVILGVTEYVSTDYDYDTIEVDPIEFEDPYTKPFPWDDLLDPTSEPPPTITGLELAYDRGNGTVNADGTNDWIDVQNRHISESKDFTFKWNALSNKADTSLYAISTYAGTETYTDKESQSESDYRYLCELYFTGIPSTIKLGNTNMSDVLAYSLIVTDPEFTFKFEDNQEAIKNLFRNYDAPYWRPSVVREIGDLVRPNDPSINKVFKCYYITGNATGGTAEPDWASTNNIDNNVHWTLHASGAVECAYYNYYGIAQREITPKVFALNTTNDKSAQPASLKAYNPPPAMEDTTGTAVDIWLYGVPSGIVIKFDHPSRYVDISHFIIYMVNVNPWATGVVRKVDDWCSKTNVGDWTPSATETPNSTLNRCTVAGTSGTPEPGWASQLNIDGTAQWTLTATDELIDYIEALPTRKNSTAYVVGDKRIFINSNKKFTVVYRVKSITTGITASSQPSTILITNITDGGVVWEKYMILQRYVVAAIINENSSQLDIEAARYRVVVDNLDPKMVYAVNVYPYDVYGIGNTSVLATAYPGLTGDDIEYYINKPQIVTGVAVTSITNTTETAKINISWTSNTEIDIDGYEVEVRGVKNTAATIQPSLTDLANAVDADGYGSTVTGNYKCYKQVSSVGIDNQIGSLNYLNMIGKVGWKYWARVRSINTSKQQGSFSHAEGDTWATHSSDISPLNSDDLNVKYRKYKYSGAFTSTTQKISWGAGTLRFKNTDGTNTDYSINAGNTGTIAVGESRWVVWTSGSTLATVTASDLYTATYKDAVIIAFMKSDPDATSPAFMLSMDDDNQFTIARSNILAGTIVASHLAVTTLSAIAAEIGTLTLVDTGGSSLSIKDASGTVRIYAAAIGASDPVLKISKTGYSAVTETDPDNLLFSSAYNNPSQADQEGTVTLTTFTGGTLATNSTLQQEKIITVTNTTDPRMVTGFMYNGLAPRALNFMLVISPVIYEYYGIEWVTTTTIRIIREIVNASAGNHVYNDMSTFKANWFISAKTLV